MSLLSFRVDVDVVLVGLEEDGRSILLRWRFWWLLLNCTTGDDDDDDDVDNGGDDDDDGGLIMFVFPISQSIIYTRNPKKSKTTNLKQKNILVDEWI